MTNSLVKKLKEVAISSAIIAGMVLPTAEGISMTFKDTNMDIGYEVEGNSIEFYDGGIMQPQYVVVKFADGTTTNLVGRENYFRFLNTANTNYREFEKFLAQNSEHSGMKVEQK